jgi:uncharacterized protein YkwD
VSAAKRFCTGAIATLLVSIMLPAVPAAAKCYSPNAKERAFVRKMNEAREQAGKGRLRLDPEISKVSKVHTRAMAKENSLYHTSTSVLGRRVTNWILLGENVGVGGTVSSLHSAFMNSPAHRANILLSSFQHVGVGVIQANDRLWVTVTFEARSDPGSPLC